MSQEKENRQHENAQSVQEGQQPHKRRVRYKGRYPKKFEEKYKELQPEKYQDTIQHVMQKGNTPAGMHISIMVKEIIDFLEIKPGQIGFDATLGYGGHTKAMLQCLQGQGHMYATDVDHEEAAKTKKRLEDLGGIQYKTKWYPNGMTTQAMYLTVMHRPEDNGLDFNFEHQKKAISREELEYLYYYLCKIMFKGAENPELTIGEIIKLV